MARVLGAFGLYSLVSLLLFGRDVVASPSTRVVGDSSADKTLYMWSFEWWPWAITHRRNPLDVDVAWAPDGFDFGLGTAGGGLALAATPLTSLLGLVPTYNILILLAPALAATTAFLLARRLTNDLAASLVAGYIFGFSSYEQGRLLGHLPLAFVALVPLVPYFMVRRHLDDLSRRAFVALLTGVLVWQFLIVTQIFFSLVVVAGVAALLATAVLGWSESRRTVAESALALLLAAIVVSPILLYAFISDTAAPLRSAFAESADALNYLVPTRRTWLRPPGAEEIASRFTATGAEHGAYLGLPFLILGALAMLRRPLSKPRLLLALLTASVVVLSFGARVKVAGHVLVPAPWSALARVPLVGSALPVRLTMYATLGAGLWVALALADRRSTARWLLVIAGVVATLPNLSQAQWSSDVPRPTYFTQAGYNETLVPGSTVLVLPYGPAGWSMLWQAEARFRFRIVGGHFALRTTPSETEWRDVYAALGSGDLAPTRLRAFLAAHNVDAVIVSPGTRWTMRRALEQAVDSPPTISRDVLIYRLSRPSAE